MNISDHNYQINTNTGNTVPQRGIEKAPEEGTVSKMPSANAQITQAAEGQVFRGQILNVTNNQVSISLDGNQVLYARMLDAVNLNIGDELAFLIKENNGNSVVIKPYADPSDTMKDSAIFKVLEQNNFSPSEKNYQIAESLMNHNMPVDKASMQRIMQQSYRFPDVPVQTLVAMNKLGIEVNRANINQFESYLANNHQLSNELNQFSANLTEFSMEMLDQIESGTFTNMEQLSGILGKGEAASFSSLLPAEQMAVFQEGLLGSISDSSEQPAVFLTDADFIPQKEGQIPPDTDIGTLVGAASEKFSEDRETVDAVFLSLMELGVSKEGISKLTDSSQNTLQLLNNINQIVKEHSETIDPAQVKELFLSENYRELFANAVKKKFSLDGDQMKQPGEIDDLYKSIYDKTNRLMELFSSTGSEAGGKMNESAKGLQERIDFMQNLNQMYTYAQLPVRLADTNLNSELFVYMNKRNLREAKEEVSALLHLDMEHLGATDVHVSLRGTNVHTRFYVEDEISAKIIDEHMTMLEKAINESGYQLTNEVVTRESSADTAKNMVVDEMLGKDLEQSVKRYSFDVRM